MGNGITVRWQKHLEEIVQFASDLLPITYYLLPILSAFTVFRAAPNYKLKLIFLTSLFIFFWTFYLDIS
jgi:hypothetical protein